MSLAGQLEIRTQQPRQHLRHLADPYRLTTATSRKLWHHMLVTDGGHRPPGSRTVAGRCFLRRADGRLRCHDGRA